jgi:hypothetical protein
MDFVSLFAAGNNMGVALLAVAIAIGVTVRVALLLRQKHDIFPRR